MARFDGVTQEIDNPLKNIRSATAEDKQSTKRLIIFPSVGIEKPTWRKLKGQSSGKGEGFLKGGLWPVYRRNGANSKDRRWAKNIRSGRKNAKPRNESCKVNQLNCENLIIRKRMNFENDPNTLMAFASCPTT